MNLRLVKNSIMNTIKHSVPKESSMIPSVISCATVVSLKWINGLVWSITIPFSPSESLQDPVISKAIPPMISKVTMT